MNEFIMQFAMVDNAAEVNILWFLTKIADNFMFIYTLKNIY